MLALLAVFALAWPSPQPPAAGRKIVLAPPVLTSTPRMDEAEIPWIRSEIQRQTLEALGKRFAGHGHLWAPMAPIAKALEAADFDAEDPKQRTAEHLTTLGKALGADAFIVVVVERIDQKNLGSRDILSNAGKPASESHAKMRVWAVDVASGTLRAVGEEPVEGLAKGPYFGTTRRDELVGAPADKGVMIRVVNQKRTEWIGRAIADGVYKTLSPWLAVGIE